MPFKSKAQMAFLYAKHPDVAAEFAKATPNPAKLPEHIKPAKDSPWLHMKKGG